MRELSPYEWMEVCAKGNMNMNDIITHVHYVSSDHTHMVLYPDRNGKLFVINQNDTYIDVSKVKEHKEDILRLIYL